MMIGTGRKNAEKSGIKVTKSIRLEMDKYGTFLFCETWTDSVECRK